VTRTRTLTTDDDDELSRQHNRLIDRSWSFSSQVDNHGSLFSVDNAIDDINYVSETDKSETEWSASSFEQSHRLCGRSSEIVALMQAYQSLRDRKNTAPVHRNFQRRWDVYYRYLS